MARIVPHLSIEPEKDESEVWQRQQALGAEQRVCSLQNFQP
jgi:hypothetical protein